MRNRAATIALLAFAAGCRDPQPVKSSFDYGEISASITLAGRDARRIATADEVGRSTALRVMRSLDPAEPRGDLAKINKIAATSRWPVPQDTFRALNLALHYGRLTDGAYDVTIAPLARMWGLGDAAAPTEPPIAELLDAARAGVGMDKVALSEDGTIAFLSPLTEINLGEVAPAYALDMALVNIRRRSITNALIRFGSSTRALGAPSREALWTETIAHPLDPAQQLGHWSFKQPGALSQCLIHGRSVVIAGTRYSGVLDPRTGLPVSNTLAAVVAGPTATLSAALARALLVVGLPDATNLLTRFPRYEAMIVPAGTPVQAWVTDGFRKHFKPGNSLAGPLQQLVPAPEAEEEEAADDQPSAEMIDPAADSAP